MKELEAYPSELMMFWHEDDLLMQLCHRLLNSADNAFDVHVSVKLETREGAWGDSLMQSMKESLIKIQEFRLQKNYIDLVISRPHDEKSKFLVCAELKYLVLQRESEEAPWRTSQRSSKTCHTQGQSDRECSLSYPKYRVREKFSFRRSGWE